MLLTLFNQSNLKKKTKQANIKFQFRKLPLEKKE